MIEVFISYRRKDSYDTQRLAGYLQKEFGEEKIFFDTSSIKPGTEWPDSIKTNLEKSKILLVIIGDKWLHIQDPQSGKRRIDMPNDWVRLEITTFINKKKGEENDILVIPVLLNNVQLPAKDFLDDELEKFADYQSVKIISTGQSTDFVRLKQILIQNNISPIDIPPVVTPMLEKPPLQLSEIEEDNFLKQYDQWRFKNSPKSGTDSDFMREMYRLFEFESYERTWEFLEKLDENGIRPFNHHPRIQFTYNRIEIWLCTFNIGHKPTYRDIRLAKISEDIWMEMMKNTRH